MARIDFVGETIEFVEKNFKGTTRYTVLKQNAARYAYELRGNSWIKVH